jgi:hypothetical protein
VRDVVGMDHLADVLHAQERRRLVVAEEAHPAVAGVDLAAQAVDVPFGQVAAVQRELEALLGLRQAALGAPLLGDVAADAAVADQAALGVATRLAGDDVHLARAARIAARDLEVEERQLLAEALLQRLERARVDLHAGDLPEAAAVHGGVAEQRGDRTAAREPGDAALGVGLPEPVGRQLGQALEARLVRLRLRQLALAPSADQDHDEVDHGPRDGGEDQAIGERIQLTPSRTGGATFSTSSMVVSPAPTFMAPLMRSAFMPSLKACSRSATRSAFWFTSALTAVV